MKIGQSLVAHVLSREGVGGGASPEPFTAENWRAGNPLQCGPGEVNHAALALAKDRAGDFADMIRHAATPFL
jgi:hypothetical protein